MQAYMNKFTRDTYEKNTYLSLMLVPWILAPWNAVQGLGGIQSVQEIIYPNPNNLLRNLQILQMREAHEEMHTLSNCDLDLKEQCTLGE